MIESSCSKHAGDIRWSWLMKFRMRLVECSPGPKLTDPHLDLRKILPETVVFISSSKWHDVFHKQSRFRDAVQCFSGGGQSHSLHDGRSEIAKAKAKARRELFINKMVFSPTFRHFLRNTCQKWDLILLKMEMLGCLEHLGVLSKAPDFRTGKGKHDANEMKRLLMPHMLDDDDITIEVMVIHYKKDGLETIRNAEKQMVAPCHVCTRICSWLGVFGHGAEIQSHHMYGRKMPQDATRTHSAGSQGYQYWLVDQQKQPHRTGRWA